MLQPRGRVGSAPQAMMSMYLLGDIKPDEHSMSLSVHPSSLLSPATTVVPLPGQCLGLLLQRCVLAGAKDSDASVTWMVLGSLDGYITLRYVGWLTGSVFHLKTGLHCHEPFLAIHIPAVLGRGGSRGLVLPHRPWKERGILLSLSQRLLRLRAFSVLQRMEAMRLLRETHSTGLFS